MKYSTGDIVGITIDNLENIDGSDTYSVGILTLDITLDDGTTYRGRAKIDADDYRYEILEDLNYDLGRKKQAMMDDMRDVLIEANYTEKDLKEFGHHVSGDEYCPPF